MSPKERLFGVLVLVLRLLSLTEGQLSSEVAALGVGNSSKDGVLADSSANMIKNDSLALDGQYYIGGLNRISEYRAKKNIEDAYGHFYDEDFVKSTKDSNKYSFIRLKNNIQVFLVSQRSTSFPSITLGVRVGSSMEPMNFPGLATLLSELLFYEWKRSDTGRETPYDLFISRNSGVFRTKVSPFLTEYHLSVKQDLFSKALLKFGSYLKGFDPKRIYLEPAMEMLQSEFESMRGLSSIRLKQILKELSVEKHVNHGFHMTNMQELIESTDFDEEALLFELVKFYGSHYSSNLMTISIVSDGSIDELENLARVFFDEIPNLGRQLITPFDLSNGVIHPYINLRNKVVMMKSAEEGQHLTIIFPIPHQSPLWKYKPAEYVSFFFTDYSDQSLYNYLTGTGAVLSLETMVEINDNGFSNFIVRFKLGSRGEKMLVKILEATLSFLKLIKEVSVSETIINQIRKKRQAVLEMSVNTIYPELSRKIVNTFLRTDCSPADVLHAGASMNRIELEHVKEIVDYLKYDNMVLILEKRDFRKSASNLLLSSQFFSDSRWKIAKKSISSFFRGINTSFRRSKPGVFPRFLTERHLGGEYLVEDVPGSVHEVLKYVNSTLANDVLKIQMPEVDPNFPRNFLIYTENVTRKEFPVSLYSALREFKDAQNLTEISLSEALSASGDFSHLHLSAPINPRDLVVALSTTKMSPISRSLCYLPTSFNPDVMVTVRLEIPKNPPKEFSSPERLAVLMFLFQHTLYDVLPSHLRENFSFERNYHLWELQEFFYGLEFTWRGFSSIFPDSLSEVAGVLSAFGSSVRPPSLQDAKLRLQEILSQSKLERDGLRILSLSYQLLDPGFMKVRRLEDELSNVSLQSLVGFADFFLQSFSVSGFVLGNATPVQIKYYLSSFVSSVRGLDDSYVELKDGSNRKSVDTSEIDKSGRQPASRNLLKSGTKQQTETRDSERDAEIQHSRPSQYKVVNLENLGYTRDTFNDMNRLPYNYSNSYFYYLNLDKNSKINIVFLQIHYGFYSEQNLAFLQMVSELNSYKHFIDFTENRCTDCSLKILPRIVLGRYLVLEFKLQSASKNIRELGELLNTFFLSYYTRPSKMISKSEVQRAKEFLLLSVNARLLPDTTGNPLAPRYGRLYYQGEPESEDLFTLSSFHMGSSKHIHISCSWKKDYIEFISNLTFDQFFKHWQYFASSSKLFISYQSQNTNYELLESLELYLPQGFSKLLFVEALYDINEQQLVFNP